MWSSAGLTEYATNLLVQRPDVNLDHTITFCFSYLKVRAVQTFTAKSQNSYCCLVRGPHVEKVRESVDKKNQLDVTFRILYFSSNSCSTCFGQPCAHHQELTTA